MTKGENKKNCSFSKTLIPEKNIQRNIVIVTPFLGIFKNYKRFLQFRGFRNNRLISKQVELSNGGILKFIDFLVVFLSCFVV